MRVSSLITSVLYPILMCCRDFLFPASMWRKTIEFTWEAVLMFLIVKLLRKSELTIFVFTKAFLSYEIFLVALEGRLVSRTNESSPSAIISKCGFSYCLKTVSRGFSYWICTSNLNLKYIKFVAASFSMLKGLSITNVTSDLGSILRPSYALSRLNPLNRLLSWERIWPLTTWL